MSTLSLVTKRSLNKSKLTLIATLALLLSACNDNDNDSTPPEVEYGYTVTITNLTYAQPLSPLGIMLHGDTKMWMAGEAASLALEQLAESGDNTELLADSNALAVSSGEGVVLPGTVSTIEVSTTNRMATHFTAATMLVNTNDAFTGLTGIDISTMAVDDEKSWNLNVYDAGTELNSEALGTIPGPADGGTGFDATRDDVDFISIHSGVVSQDDGLSSSVLTQAHRFDNPAVKLTITRTQ